MFALASMLESLQVELLLAEFFSSITITVLSAFQLSSHLSRMVPLWRGFLLLGALNTALSYRGVKNALRGNDNFNLRKASVVWAALWAFSRSICLPLSLIWLLVYYRLAACALSTLGPECAGGTWRTCVAEIARAALVGPYIVAQVALVRVVLRRHIQAREVALQSRLTGKL
ncbi:hypothetical protein FB451DRAFT_1551142 [Mycena latifolia]|nr:hypothetical protein FB451DRAFT_1551142 [Mycena latifolia]